MSVSVAEAVVQADFWVTSVLETCTSKLMYWQQFETEVWSSMSSLKIRIALIALVTESKNFFIANSVVRKINIFFKKKLLIYHNTENGIFLKISYKTIELWLVALKSRLLFPLNILCSVFYVSVMLNK